MKIAYTMSTQRGGTDQLLFDVVVNLQAQGLRVAGTVQINTEREKTHHCDMDVKILPNGPIIRISQNLGAEAQGCRLDAGALENAVAHAQKEVEAGADVLVINKFGKQEACGAGFRDVIAQALALDLPVLVGVNETNLAAFQTFADGAAIRLEANLQDLVDWLAP